MLWMHMKVYELLKMLSDVFISVLLILIHKQHSSGNEHN